ncbi:hypothetical protein Celaphus_00017437 [Cervus elaphus hippelaphus]|uniref:Uncharacterized protein n=1 Tax=Cervus elaphus hippelaphus TaxID=46360 RepID=A0A212D5L3_CEREH|nr:hypothetical protein Celaphus_00017437 [Cervus elaphus hippelaphus]
MKVANGFCVLFMLHLWFFDSGRTGKVLVWPVDFSHWINLEVILEELHLRGHEITILVPTPSFLLDHIKIPFNVEILQLSVTKKLSQKSLNMVSIHLLLKCQNFHDKRACANAVTNKELLSRLRTTKFASEEKLWLNSISHVYTHTGSPIGMLLKDCVLAFLLLLHKFLAPHQD